MAAEATPVVKEHLDIQTIIKSLRDEVDKLKTELDNEREENRTLNATVNFLKCKRAISRLNR